MADDRPTPPASHHTGSDADDESSDSDTSDTAASIPPPSPPAPIRRRKRVRILEPYEPEPFGELFRYHEGDYTRKCTTRKRVCILPASIVTPPVPTPVPSPISVLPPVSMPDLTPVASPAPPPSPVSPPPEPHPYMLPTYTAPTPLRFCHPCHHLQFSTHRLPLYRYHHLLHHMYHHPLPLRHPPHLAFIDWLMLVDGRFC